MALADPNMRCTCGHRRFREALTRTSQSIERWVEFDSAAATSYEFGRYFGAGSVGLWGLFTDTQHTTLRSLVCENCHRVRSSRPLSSYAIWGSYASDDKFYIIASDITDVACLYLRFTSEDGTEVYEESIRISADAIEPLARPAPATTAGTPGALTATTLLEAWLPEVLEYSTFTVALVDRCANRTENLARITLEDNVPTINLKDADLGGAPIEWVRDSLPFDIAGIGQVPGTTLNIPFEKCDAVIEYDARLGSLPTDQGWTRSGAGAAAEWSLDAGGVLRANLTNTNYFTKEVSTSSAPSLIWSYATLFLRDSVGAAAGEGFDLDMRIAPGASGSWDGTRLTHRSDEWYTTTLDGTAEVMIAASSPYPEGWFSVASGRSRSLSPDRGFIGITGIEGGRPYIIDPVTTWGGLVGGPVNPGIRASFGMTAGTSVDGWVRNVVVSASGRFIRPLFRTSAPAEDSVLRLYLTADNESGSPQTEARFKVKYGSFVGGDDPYAMPSTAVEQTVSFTTKNQIVEASFSLTGLTSRSPMWFTIERDWSHANDLIRSAVRLLDVTLRGS